MRASMGTNLKAKVGAIEVASGLAEGSGVPHFGHSDDGTSDTAASSDNTSETEREAWEK